MGQLEISVGLGRHSRWVERAQLGFGIASVDTEAEFQFEDGALTHAKGRRRVGAYALDDIVVRSTGAWPKQRTNWSGLLDSSNDLRRAVAELESAATPARIIADDGIYELSEYLHHTRAQLRPKDVLVSVVSDGTRRVYKGNLGQPEMTAVVERLERAKQAMGWDAGRGLRFKSRFLVDASERVLQRSKFSNATWTGNRWLQNATGAALYGGVLLGCLGVIALVGYDAVHDDD